MAAALMNGCATSVHLPKAQLPALALELANVQEEYLNAHQPRPTGEQGIRAEAPELQRRLSLIIDTWDDYVLGQADARRSLARGHLKLLAFSPLNDYERTYVELLLRDFGIEVATARMPVTDISRRIYIYGYNTTVGQHLEEKYGLNAFVGLIESAVRRNTTEKFNYYSPYFIPWRFNDDARIIELDSAQAADLRKGE